MTNTNPNPHSTNPPEVQFQNTHILTLAHYNVQSQPHNIKDELHAFVKDTGAQIISLVEVYKFKGAYADIHEHYTTHAHGICRGEAKRNLIERKSAAINKTSKPNAVKRAEIKQLTREGKTPNQGGLALAVRHDITHMAKVTFKHDNGRLMKAVFERVTNDGRDLVIWQAYAAQDKAEKENLIQYLAEKTRAEHEKGNLVIVMGDFNTVVDQSIDRHPPTETTNARHASLNPLLEEGLCDAYRYLNRKKKEFSYITEKAKSRIDYILIDNALRDDIIEAKIVPNQYTGSAHRPVIVRLNLQALEGLKQNTNSSPTYSIIKEARLRMPRDSDRIAPQVKWSKFRQLIEEATWETDLSLDERTAQYERIVQSAAEQALGRTTAKNHERNRHAPKQLETLLRQRRKVKRALRAARAKAPRTDRQLTQIAKVDCLYEKTFSTPPDASKEGWAQCVGKLKRHIKKQIKQTKKELAKKTNTTFKKYRDELAYKNPKLFNRLVTRPRKQPRAPLAVNQATGGPTTEGENRANFLMQRGELLEFQAQYWETLFTSKGSEGRDSHRDLIVETTRNTTISEAPPLPQLEMADLSSLIKGTKKGTSAGPNEITYDMLKELPHRAQSELLEIINTAIREGRIPTSWRTSTLISLPKDPNADQTNPDNRRGIALQQAEYKLLATWILHHIRKHVKGNDIISKNQYGFQRDKHILHPVTKLIDQINDAMQHNKECHVAYVDIHKAYDSVELWAITDTLTGYKLDRNTIALMENIYTDNTAIVSTELGNTRTIHTTRGVKQGCPLSPELFVLAINPILKAIESQQNGYTLESGKKESTKGYVDDLCFTTSSNEEMQEIITTLERYLTNLNMRINPKKSGYSTRVETAPNIITLGGPIQRYHTNESYKYLGFHINLELNWKHERQAAEQKYETSLRHIQAPNIAANTKIAYINTVTNKKLEWSMQLVEFPNKTLRALDKEARDTVRKAASAAPGYREITHQSKSNGGWGLHSIEHLATQTRAAALRTQLNMYEEAELDTPPAAQKMKELNKILKPFSLAASKTTSNGQAIREIGNYEWVDRICAKYPNLEWNAVMQDRHLLPYTTIRAKGIKINQWDYYRLAHTAENNHAVPDQFAAGLETVTKAERGELEVNARWGNPTDTRATPPTERIPRNEFQRPAADDELWVWTDGSSTGKGRAKMAHAAVFIKKGSQHNAVFQPQEGRDNLTAELAAIERALLMVPLDAKIRIVTDCKSAIALINRQKKGLRVRRYQTMLQNIRRQAQEIEQNGGEVRYEHVYSHIKAKTAQAKKKGKKALREWTRKLNKQRTRLGRLAAVAEAGNEEADKLTQAPRATPEPQRPRGDSPPIIITDLRTNTITDSPIRRIIGKEQQNRIQTILDTKEGPLSYAQNGTIVDPRVVPTKAKLTKLENAKHWTFWLKLREGSLATNHRIYKRAAKLIELSSTGPKQDRMQLNQKNKYIARNYKSENCKHCLETKQIEVKETPTHVLSDCSSGREIRTRAAQKIESLVRQAGAKKRMPAFYGNTDINPYLCSAGPASRAVGSLGKNRGNMAQCPRELPKALREIGVAPKRVHATKQQIIDILFEAATEMWCQRCDYKHKEKREKKQQDAQKKKARQNRRKSSSTNSSGRAGTHNAATTITIPTGLIRHHINTQRDDNGQAQGTKQQQRKRSRPSEDQEDQDERRTKKQRTAEHPTHAGPQGTRKRQRDEADNSRTAKRRKQQAESAEVGKEERTSNEGTSNDPARSRKRRRRRNE